MKKIYLHFKTETVNSITHAFGVLFGIIFIPLLINRSVQHDTTAQVIGNIIYGLCFLTTFIFSTVYHALRKPLIKVRFRVLDHVSIYFFIAATYTPFILHFILNTTGVMLLSLIWFFAITGSFLKLYYVQKFALVSVVSYLFMGLLFLFVQKSFFENMPNDIIRYIYYGVAFYLSGIIFFLWRKWKHHHALWHLLVLAGGVCHFKAVWLSVSRAV
ncbi:MAG: hemolysin III family protein [Ginsengibacter sp.]